MHGTRGTTGSEGCLLVHSVVGNSLIFPIRPFALLRSREAGRRVRERYGILQVAPVVFWDKTKGRHASEVHGKQIVAQSVPGPAALYCIRPSSVPESWSTTLPPGLEVRGVDAFKPVANLHRCYLRQDPVFLLLAAPGGAQGGQGFLLQAPPAGRSERPCRATGCLLTHPAAQQLLGKVGLLRANAEQCAASATATDKCDRAAPGRTGLSTSAPALHLRRPSLHLPRSHHELLWHEGAGWPSRLRKTQMGAALSFLFPFFLGTPFFETPCFFVLFLCKGWLA